MTGAGFRGGSFHTFTSKDRPVGNLGRVLACVQQHHDVEACGELECKNPVDGLSNWKSTEVTY